MMQYADMHKLSEDERIQLIGNLVMEKRVSAWCLTDNTPGKPERYREKLIKHFPLLQIDTEIHREFPFTGSAGFKVGPPLTSSN